MIWGFNSNTNSELVIFALALKHTTILLGQNSSRLGSYYVSFLNSFEFVILQQAPPLGITYSTTQLSQIWQRTKTATYHWWPMVRDGFAPQVRPIKAIPH
jgi:hypothetical protein